MHSTETDTSSPFFSVGLVQLDPAWGDAGENMRRAERLIAPLPPASLYLLPEMWAMGFDMHPTEATVSASREALGWMRAQARERKAWMAGTLAWPADAGEANEGKGMAATAPQFVNRLFVVNPQGEVAACYDKRHLFTYGGEPGAYTSGHQRLVTEVDGHRVLWQTCYDLRFPVFFRNRRDYDMAVCLACWPTSRLLVWDTLLRARAIENQCFVVGVNRAGSDPACLYPGASAVIDAYGHTLLALNNEGKAEAAVVALDFDRQERFRAKFPVLRDADSFTINP